MSEAPRPKWFLKITWADEDPVRDAFSRLTEHCLTCRTCTTVDSSGTNQNLPCETRDSLSEALKEARRTSA